MFRKLIRKIHILLAGSGDPEKGSAETAPPALPEDDLHLDNINQQFSRELFVQLLLELPAHRKTMASAYQEENYRRLRDSVHQLLGAAAYCDAPELETALRELRLALKTDNRDTINYYYARAVNVIDSTIRFSGYR